MTHQAGESTHWILHWPNNQKRCKCFMYIICERGRLMILSISFVFNLFASGVRLWFCSIFLNCWNQRSQYGIDLQCFSQLELHGYMHNFSLQVVCTATNLQRLRLVAAQIVLDSSLQLLGEIFQTSSKVFSKFFFFSSWKPQNSLLNLMSFSSVSTLRLTYDSQNDFVHYLNAQKARFGQNKRIETLIIFHFPA